MTELSTDEEYWLNHQPWLLSLGYQLRPRFRPDWVPSWVTRPAKDIFALKEREDFLRHRGIAPIMDAIRLSDNRQVMMKKIYSKEVRLGVYEHQHLINAYVSSPDQLTDPDNHCIPCIEILRIPGDYRHVILVMPLCRRWYVPRFDTVGEALDMIQQAFKGLQYLHRNRIAHRDCTGFNFVMDGSGMYPNGFHPIAQERNREFTGPAFQKYTRTQCPPKYYWIDFEFSFKFDPSDPCPRIIPLHAADTSAPEYRHLKANPEGPHALVDPFPTDVYYLGNMVKMFFTEGSTWFELRRRFGFGFLKPLVEAMTQEDPARRPNMDQCVIQLEEIIKAQYSWTLRSQVWHPTDNPLGFIYRFFPHWARRIVYVITRTPAIPSRHRRPSPYLRLYTHLLLGLWVIMLLAVQYYSRHVQPFIPVVARVVSLY